MALLPFLFGKLLERVTRANQNIYTPQSNAGTYGSDFQAWAPQNARTGAPTQYPVNYGPQTSPPIYQQVFSQPQYEPSPPNEGFQSAPTQNFVMPNNRYQALSQASPPQMQTQDSWGKLITNQKTASPTLVAYITSLAASTTIWIRTSLRPTKEGYHRRRLDSWASCRATMVMLACVIIHSAVTIFCPSANVCHVQMAKCAHWLPTPAKEQHS
jgi:hypothetical protein